MSRTRIIGRKEVLALLADPAVVLLVSYGIDTTVHVYNPADSAIGGTVRFDTFSRLVDDGLIEERPKYDKQPVSLKRYTLTSAGRGEER